MEHPNFPDPTRPGGAPATQGGVTVPPNDRMPSPVVRDADSALAGDDTPLAHELDTGVSPFDPGQEAEFLAPYIFSPERFAREILDIKYDPWQQRASDKLLTDHFVTVRSGNGPGKTFFEATIIFWFLITRHMAQIPCTASTATQLKTVLWSNLSRMRFRSDYLQKRTRITEDMVQVIGYEKAWFAVARTAQNTSGEVVEALQGFHGDFVLFVVDEASGVPDKALDALESAATGSDSYGLMCSNATRRQGMFFRSWHKDAHLWSGVHVKPQDTTRVTDAFRKRMEEKYGGRNTNGYRIRVDGEFPKQSDMGLLSEEAYDHPEVQVRGDRADIGFLRGDVTFSCDPAGDAPESDAATIGIRIGNAIYEIAANHSMDLESIGDQILGRAMEIALARKAQGLWDQRTIPCYIDVIGIGLGLAQLLERKRRECIEVLKVVQRFGSISPEAVNELSESERELLTYVFDGDFIINPLRVNVGGGASKPLKADEADDYDPTYDELPPELTGASGREVFQNLRAQLFCYVANEISSRRIQICQHYPLLREDLTSLQKSYATNNKIKIQSKKEFRNLNEGRSTDFGDAAVLLFVEDVGKDIDTFEYDADSSIGVFGANLDPASGRGLFSTLSQKPDRMAKFYGDSSQSFPSSQSEDQSFAQTARPQFQSAASTSPTSPAHSWQTVDDRMNVQGSKIGRKKFTSVITGPVIVGAKSYDF